jgi:hypothetical protein
MLGAGVCEKPVRLEALGAGCSWELIRCGIRRGRISAMCKAFLLSTASSSAKHMTMLGLDWLYRPSLKMMAWRDCSSWSTVWAVCSVPVLGCLYRDSVNPSLKHYKPPTGCEGWAVSGLGGGALTWGKAPGVTSTWWGSAAVVSSGGGLHALHIKCKISGPFRGIKRRVSRALRPIIPCSELGS